MAKEKGTKVLLKIGDGATPTEVFTTLAGQRSTEMQLAGAPIDVTDKTTNGWASYLQGQNDMTITCSGVAVWPDTAGLVRLRTQFLAQEPINCEIVLNDAGDKFGGAFSITQMNITGAHDGATEYAITLQAFSAPTYTAGT